MTCAAESLPTPATETGETEPSARIELPDEAATAAFAGRLARQARAGDLLALSGDLGAGKTSFARAFINALPGEAEDVPSPTFTLVQTYRRGDLEVWHVDLYRLGGAEDALELGLEEGFAEAVTLLEWPERLGASLPRKRLDLAFAFSDSADADRRTVTVTPRGGWRGEAPGWLQTLIEESAA